MSTRYGDFYNQKDPKFIFEKDFTFGKRSFTGESVYDCIFINKWHINH